MSRIQILRLFEPKICGFKPAVVVGGVSNLWTGSYRIEDPAKYLNRFPRPSRWPRYNEIIQDPQTNPGEDPRPATYYHYRENVKTSPKKMWHVTKFVTGMNVDEAIKQLKFLPMKPAAVLADILEEAQDIALRKHNFEYKSKMWIDRCLAVKGLVLKGVRKHARMRYGEIRYFYSHINVKLVEGEPPVHFYRPKRDGNDCLKHFYDELRSRKLTQAIDS